MFNLIAINGGMRGTGMKNVTIYTSLIMFYLRTCITHMVELIENLGKKCSLVVFEAYRFMANDEFEKMMSDAGLMDGNFGSRDAVTVFNLSMMTQVNELDYDRHLQGSYLEFLEAMARAADKISMPPSNLEVL